MYNIKYEFDEIVSKCERTLKMQTTRGKIMFVSIKVMAINLKLSPSPSTRQKMGKDFPPIRNQNQHSMYFEYFILIILAGCRSSKFISSISPFYIKFLSPKYLVGCKIKTYFLPI